LRRNPVLENWLAQLSLRDSVARIDALRVLFWLAALAAIWPFICMTRRWIAQASELVPAVERPAAQWPESLFGPGAIVRALILFNLLFAVQTVMDINYLWGGAALPDGMTYATYAHRGAYPLVVTALLAAAFVVAALRPGSVAEGSPLIRTLVFLWTGQNVLLVVSSILRLNLYVEAYSLTELRVAAFVWMLVVAVGLVLIMVRIITYRSTAWLIAANAVALAATLYVCGFINFPYVIASYNAAHSREIAGGQGVPLDLTYVLRLGPQAIPAIDAYLANPNARLPIWLRQERDALARYAIDTTRQDWRAWSFRAWRLRRYLEAHPPALRS
jgi:hypothetical protein